MIAIDNFISSFSNLFNRQSMEPWQYIANISRLIADMLPTLSDEYSVNDNIAVHKTALIEPNVILKAPVIIGKGCFIGANSYLRGGVFLAENVSIGTSCEIKSTVIFENSSVAHFNFIGDSIVGSSVNFEAGAVTANHYNERENKTIYVSYHSNIINTNTNKFGSLVGDNSKIGANAVLSPGTILPAGTIVKRLELIEQISL